HLTAPMLFLGAYLLGSIPFGLMLAKIFGGTDVRKAGSGNIGATNVARVVGPIAGLLTLFLDAAKGWAAVWLASRVTHGSARVMVGAGFCVPRFAGDFGAGDFPTSRKYSAVGQRRRAEIFVRQKTRRAMKKIAILGAGSWGTALALVLARSRESHQISLWVRDSELSE